MTYEQIELKYVVLVIILGHYFNSMRDRHKLTRSAIQPPSLAPWFRVMNWADDSSFLDITGFSRAAFMRLEGDLFPDGHVVGTKRGRPCELDERGQLGLYLLFCNSRMQQKFICLIFGVTPSTCSDVIRDMRLLVCQRLKRNNAAKIKFPNEEEKIIKYTVPNGLHFSAISPRLCRGAIHFCMLVFSPLLFRS